MRQHVPHGDAGLAVLRELGPVARDRLVDRIEDVVGGTSRAQAKVRLREEWPSSAKVFLPGGKIPEVGDVFVQKDLARTFQRIVDVENKNRRKGRSAAMRAAAIGVLLVALGIVRAARRGPRQPPPRRPQGERDVQRRGLPGLDRAQRPAH